MTWNGVERRSYPKTDKALSALRGLTAKLLDTIFGIDNESGITDFQTKDGRVAIEKLFYSDDVGIAKIIANKGGIHAQHEHPMTEWIGITSGKIIIHFADKDVVVGKYEAIMIPKNTPHIVEYVEDVSGWIITMPKDEGFR